MSLQEKISKDVLVATKNQDKKLLKTLRFLQAAIKNKEIELRPKLLKEEDVIAVIKKQVKQIQESMSFYKDTEAYQEQKEEGEYNLSVLKKYLPEPLSEAELKKIVQEVIEELKPSSMKDMGSVIRASMAKAKGGADAKLLSQMVRTRLQNL